MLRKQQRQDGLELLRVYEARGAVRCECGERRDEHDLMPDYALQCAKTGCLDFVPAFSKSRRVA